MDYLENILERYVLATLDTPTKYLIFKGDVISFTSNIARATKTVSKGTANAIRNDFYSYTGRTDMELAVVPLRITYELVRNDVTDGDDYVS